MSTIAAISTAPTIGGIGIVRISGDNCFEILNKIFIPKKREDIANIKGYTIKYGNIVDNKNNKIIDEVLVSYFKAPKSYTTENMCEINSHGGITVVRKILEACLENGAVLAEPGEFTKRAFLNGRIDLVQAEAVIDIINSKTNKELDESVKQLNGGLSEKISKIRQKIMDLMVNIEVSIDYPEYDVEDVEYEDAENKLINIKKELENLCNSFENGKIIKDGIKTAIIGSPNAGKSSLLNELLKEERAIVTDLAGTTRDIIEEQITIDGIPFKIIDTAGIRESDNKVEQIGIKKSKEVAEKSDIIIAMFDNSKELTEEDKYILNLIKDKKAIILLNKIDVKENNLEKNEEIININKPIIKVSMLEKEGIEDIYRELSNIFNLNEINLNDDIIVTNIRHKDLIQKSIEHLNQALDVLTEKMPIDIIAINIKEILEELGKITGESVSDDIIKEIFSKFCLGK